MRNSGRLAAIQFHTYNPNYKMSYAVRQSSKEGGYARLYAKIEERKNDNAYGKEMPRIFKSLATD